MLEVRQYGSNDKSACLAFFDANCPAFFSPVERSDYVMFLDGIPAGYRVAVLGGAGSEVEVSVGAFGLSSEGTDGGRLQWILLDPGRQGMGLGSLIMNEVIRMSRDYGWRELAIAASHRSAPFFARFGAKSLRRTQDGWGPGMDRVDMLLAVKRSADSS